MTKSLRLSGGLLAGAALASLAAPSVALPIGGSKVALLKRQGQIISVIESRGWTGIMPTASKYPFSPNSDDLAPNTAPLTFTCYDPGFDGNGNPTTITRTITLAKRLGQVFANQLSADGNVVTLSDYVYSTSVCPGISNLSTVSPPPPAVTYTKTDHRVVGDTLHLEAVGFQRHGGGGKPIAAYVFTVDDGGAHTPVSCTASAPTPISEPGDLGALDAYQCDVNISTLATGTVTANAKAYPILGGSGQVLDSSTSPVRNFTPQVFLHNAALAAAPYYIYVAGTGTTLTTGNDTTCVPSTSATTAAASPCASYKGAFERAKALMPGNIIDGLIIRQNGAIDVGSVASVATGTYQSVGETVIEHDPTVTRASSPLTIGIARFFRVAWLRYRDLSIVRTAAVNLPGGTAQTTFENVTFDTTGATAALNGNGGAPFAILGMTLAGTPTSNMLAAGTGETKLIRGLDSPSNIGSIECYAVLASRTHDSVCQWNSGRSVSNSVLYDNKFLSITSTFISPTTDAANFALVQNVFEWTGTGAQAVMIRPSGDTPSAVNLTHWIEWYNTLAGSGNYGRENWHYNSTPGTLRTHALASSRGNIGPARFIKQNWFVAQDGTGYGCTGSCPSADSYITGWSAAYGVGFQGDLRTHNVDSDSGNGTSTGMGGDRAPLWPGLGTKFNPSATVLTGFDPQYNTPAMTSVTGTAGAGNGNYHVGTSSAAKCLVSDPMLPHDMDGNPRFATKDTAGAYVSAGSCP